MTQKFVDDYYAAVKESAELTEPNFNLADYKALVLTGKANLHLRTGESVRLICTDRDGDGRSIVGLVRITPNYERLLNWNPNGLHTYNLNSKNDLIITAL